MSKVIIVSSEVAKNVAERLHNYLKSVEPQPLTIAIKDIENELHINVIHTDGDIMVFKAQGELYDTK